MSSRFVSVNFHLLVAVYYQFLFEGRNRLLFCSSLSEFKMEEEDALRSIYAFQYIITACQRFDGKDLAQHIVASKELYNRLVLSQIQFVHEKEFVFYSKSVVEKYRF